MVQGEALALWSQYAEYFEQAAMEHPEAFDLEELRRDVASGKLMTIGIFDGVSMVAGACVELCELREGKTLHVRYLAGDHMEMWLTELHERLQEIARAYGCRWLSLTGRRGWQKRLKVLGWGPVAIQMKCEVQ